MAKKRIYKFTGKEGSFLPEALLKKWIQRHQDHHEVRGHFYGKDFLLNILNQPGCMGIRCYHAIDDKGQKALVLVGADAKGASIWGGGKTAKGKLKDGPPSGGGDQGSTCPPFC